jgi:hypothetical protein
MDSEAADRCLRSPPVRGADVKRLIVDAAISDGIERECGRRLALKQAASSFC